MGNSGPCSPMKSVNKPPFLAERDPIGYSLQCRKAKNGDYLTVLNENSSEQSEAAPLAVFELK